MKDGGESKRNSADLTVGATGCTKLSESEDGCEGFRKFRKFTEIHRNKGEESSKKAPLFNAKYVSESELLVILLCNLRSSDAVW